MPKTTDITTHTIPRDTLILLLACAYGVNQRMFRPMNDGALNDAWRAINTPRTPHHTTR